MRYEIGARGRFARKHDYPIPEHLADGPCVVDIEPGDRVVWFSPDSDVSASDIELIEASGVSLWGAYAVRATLTGRDLEAFVRLAMRMELVSLWGVVLEPGALARTRLKMLVLADTWIGALPVTAEDVFLITTDLAPWIGELEQLPTLQVVHVDVRRGVELPSALLRLPTPRLELSQITETEGALLELFERAPIAPRSPLVVRITHQTPEVYARVDRAIAGTGITVDRAVPTFGPPPTR